MEENLKNNTVDGISLGDIFFLFKKNILLIAIITAIITVIGGIYAVGFKDTTYSTTATAMIVVPSNSNDDERQLDYSYALNLMHTYEDYIQSNAVLKKVGEELKKEYADKYPESYYSPNFIRRCIQIEMQQYSLILTVRGESVVDKEFTINLVNKVMKCTKILVDEELKAGDVKPLANTFVVIDEAENVSASKGTLVVLIISFVLGLIVGLLVVFVKYLINDTYTSKDDFEKSTGVNVLVLLPDPVILGGNKNEK